MSESRGASPLVVFTVGHSNRALDEFLRLLQAHAVTLVVDVRKLPGSRANPQFDRETLERALNEVQIGYLHVPQLGGLRRRKPGSPNTAWRNASFQGFADHMLTSEFDEGLRLLLERADGGRAASMCSEAVPWRCHRSLIADALVARGIEVRHILSPTRTDLHRLRPWARVDGTRITYPDHHESTKAGKRESETRV